MARMQDVHRGRGRRVRGVAAKKLAQLRRVSHFVDVVATLALGRAGPGSEPQNLTGLKVRNPEGEFVMANLIRDGAAFNVGAREIEEAALPKMY